MSGPRALVVGALLGVAAGAAWGCGVCVEDRIAATYDHAVVERAKASGRVVVSCAVDGRFDAERLARAARAIGGVVPASVRVSAEPGAIAFALDASRRSPEAAVRLLRRAAPGATVEIVGLR